MSERVHVVSPFRLNLEQQRKRAKDLLRALHRNETDAIRRLGRSHPHPVRSEMTRLADAQLVIARELGLASWQRLRRHIEASRKSIERIDTSRIAPDAGMTTLHLRCGHDIGNTLRMAGFLGDFETYTDPLCDGAVTQDADWLERRADYILDAFGPFVTLTREQILQTLQTEEQVLARAFRYERVVLWFEHDIYDQLILVRVLTVLSQNRPGRIELVSAGTYPGTVRYIGLGQLPPEALLLLWDHRIPVSPAMIQTGRTIWSALTQSEPTELARLARDGTPALPEMGKALFRFMQEYPWDTDGLALSHRLVLRLVQAGAATAGQVWHDLKNSVEPMPWLSDLMFRHLLASLTSARLPAIVLQTDGAAQDWHAARLTLTRAGCELLAGSRNGWSLGLADRSLGGVRLSTETSAWVWNDSTGTVRPVPLS